ncbi:hypothetical protein PsorP6_002393 [Peronosclerospora sorghi]|uniref:Uncharacterized protein n=1 Tax=Peronosclerospora sorghi TaxID=230839 RepID=A0ACC0WRG6_9STRA|nr:hypothetical protein PsorP6_002393 [Peronosclerospora sorghi]
MSSTRRCVRVKENADPLDVLSSRPGKIPSGVPGISSTEKRPRYMKMERKTDGTGGPRRVALRDVTNRRVVLGDATNRINIKKATLSSVTSSIPNAGTLAKKKIIASKRNLNNVNAASRCLRDASISKQNLSNFGNVSTRHLSATTSSSTSISSRSSSSVIDRMSRPLSPTASVASSLESKASMGQDSTMVDIVPSSEENGYDIDSEDMNDPTSCWQYAADITKYHLEVETLHIAVSLIDYYLEKNLTVQRQRLQLVGVSAMFIASKYEEIYPPEAADFVKITDNAYTRDEVFQMEAQMLATVGYRVTFPTAFQFMKRFLKASRTCDDRVEHFAHYAIDRSLQEYKLIKYLPSTIAASAVHVARTQMRDLPAWSSTLEHHSSYSERSLHPCVKDIKEILWNTYKGVGKMAKLTAARRKFSKERFMKVATEPLEFGQNS